MNEFLKRSSGDEVDSAKEASLAWQHDVRLAKEEIATFVPDAFPFILVDDCQWRRDSALMRRAIPFLQKGGTYWGPPPGDEVAIAELERLREAGCSTIVFGWPSFWWFSSYPRMYAYIRNNFPCVHEGPRVVGFDISCPSQKNAFEKFHQFPLNINLGQDGIIALHKYKTLYFPIPKVATSSLKAVCAEILREELGELYDPAWKPAPFRSEEGRLALLDKSILIEPWTLPEFRHYFKFTFLRNPFDRLVSCYSQKIRESSSNDRNFKNGVENCLVRFKNFYSGMTFREFVHCVTEIPDDAADPHFMSQRWLISDGEGKPIVDAICNVDNIVEDFERIFVQKIGIRGARLPHLLKSRRKPYDQYYDQELRALVRTRYADDFALLEVADAEKRCGTEKW